MSEKFANQFTFGHPIGAVHAALTDPGYWHDRLAELEGGGAAVTAFTAEAGITTVAVSMSIAAAALPARAARARPLGVRFTFEESWRALRAGAAIGTLHGAVAGAPVRLAATFRLESGDAGTTLMRQHGFVEAGVPLVGRMIEDGVRAKVIADFARNCRYTEDWAGR
ncbi:DUF2505 domain-containing protein [Nocardia sp. NPDC055321]